MAGIRRAEGSRRAPLPRLGEVFSPAGNSLNVLRLVFALVVLVGHATAAASLADVHLGVLGDATEGTIAVYGFFGISGFLITRSADRRSAGRYAWQRVLRIFPALWLCLVVTAFVFAPLSGAPASACGTPCLLSLHDGSIGYVVHNGVVPTLQQGVGTTLRTVTVPGVWNFSLWTIPYELLCYLLVGALAVVGVLRRPWVVALVAAPVWVAAAWFAVTRHLLPGFFYAHTVTLVPVFLTGSLLYLWRDRVADSGWLALACAVLYGVGLVTPFGGPGTAFFPFVNGPAMLAPLVVYPVLWLGCHLPLRRLFARNDYSYGTYVFGGPVEQLFASWGLPQRGLLVYVLASVVATLGVAVLSWRLIERPALRLKEARAGAGTARGLWVALLGRED